MGSRSPPEDQTREFPEGEGSEVTRQGEAEFLEKLMGQESVITSYTRRGVRLLERLER